MLRSADIIVLYIIQYVCTEAQSFLTLCDPMDCSSPGSSVHGILQARTLEWAAMPFPCGMAPFDDSLTVFSLPKTSYHLYSKIIPRFKS